MKGHWIPYNAEEQAWLLEHRGLPIGDYHRGFTERFGREDVSKVNLHSLRKRNGWRTGRTGCFEKGVAPINKGIPCAPGIGGRHPNSQRAHFKSGNLPHNTNYAGHERISKDGYVEISIEERNPYTGYERRYVLKHRWLWEKLHGSVPKGMALKCLGDRTNTDPSNWVLIERALLPRLNGRFGRGFDEAPDDLKPTILAIAKLEQEVRKLRRNAHTRPAADLDRQIG